MWWRRSWFSLKRKADIPGQTEGCPATSIGPRVLPVGSLQQRAPRSTAVPSQTAGSEPTQRDRHLQLIAEQGRMGWQKASGYAKRARAEATIGRYKRVIGDELRSHTEERRATEMDVAVHVLNRMLELGRPNTS